MAGSPAATSARPGRSDGARHRSARHPSAAHRRASSARLVGLAAAGTARRGRGSRRRSPRRPAGRRRDARGRPIGAAVPDAELRENDPLGDAARRADRTALVQTDDGVLLAVEEIGPPDAPLTVVFVHGYTLSMASWTFQRRTWPPSWPPPTATGPTPGWSSTTSAGTAPPGAGRREHSTIEQLAARPGHGARRAGAARAGRAGRALHGRHDRSWAWPRCAPSCSAPGWSGAALLSTSSGNLADLDFGLPELLTRVRAAVLPVAAWTMRRRPGLRRAHPARWPRTLVSAATRSLSFASSDVDPALVHYVDAMIAGTPVDVIAEFYPALAGLDETGGAGAAAPRPDAGAHRRRGQDDPEGAQRADRGAARAGGRRRSSSSSCPDAGHMVLLEKPDEVTRALTALLPPGRRRPAASGADGGPRPPRRTPPAEEVARTAAAAPDWAPWPPPPAPASPAPSSPPPAGTSSSATCRPPGRPRLVVVGEAPGATEDETGRPFVGQVGRAAGPAARRGGAGPGAGRRAQHREVPAAGQPDAEGAGGRPLQRLAAPPARPARRPGGGRAGAVLGEVVPRPAHGARPTSAAGRTRSTGGRSGRPTTRRRRSGSGRTGRPGPALLADLQAVAGTPVSREHVLPTVADTQAFGAAARRAAARPATSSSWPARWARARPR